MTGEVREEINTECGRTATEESAEQAEDIQQLIQSAVDRHNIVATLQKNKMKLRVSS